MSNNEQRTHVTNYEGTGIYVDENGRFYATPTGCRKERTSFRIGEIKSEIVKVVDRARQGKRQDANQGLYIFDERAGVVDVNAMYIGVRGKAGKFGDAGHVFQISGQKQTKDRDLRAVPPGVSQEDIFELEACHETLTAARTKYNTALAKSTKRLRLGHFYDYDMTAERLIKDQGEVVQKIRLIQVSDES